MQRDMEMIRALLLDIEENQNIHGGFLLSDGDFGVGDDEVSKVQYHLRLLLDAKYIEGKDNLSMESLFAAPRENSVVGLENAYMEKNGLTPPKVIVTRMTWEGHDFLDTVRDSKVWEKTKEAVKGVGGVSIDTIKDVAKELAKGLIKHQVKKHTGVELDL